MARRKHVERRGSGRRNGMGARTEAMESRILLAVDLPGMHPVDPAADRFDGQVIYLDFDGANGVAYTTTVVSTSVNDPPVVANLSKSTNQDTTCAFASGDFTAAFSDPDVGDTLQKIRIVSLPTHGTVRFGGTALTLNQEIAGNQLANLTYTPATGYTGSDSFAWNGSDGSLYAAAAASVNLTITAVNHAPTVSDISKALSQDTILAFAASDFTGSFSDSDSGDTLQKIKIVSLPAHGALKLSGTTVTLNQEIASSQLANLSYVPDTGYTGSDSFGWNGSDGSLYASSIAFVNLTVGPVNHAPTITVTAVYVRGSTWASGYLSFLAANMSGSSSTYGYAIPVGSGAAQLQTLAWRNLNRISIAFSEDVTVAQAQFAIVGSVGSYSVSGFAYNATDHVATLSLSAVIGADKLYIALPGSGTTPVTDIAGNVLDGDWTNPTSYSQVGTTDTFPSGNGVAGGDFAFRFDVLPGDSTGGSLGKVNVADINQTKSRSSLPETTSSYRSDFDGNDLVNVADIAYVKSWSSISSLPVDPPVLPSFGPTFSPVSLLLSRADTLLGKHSFGLW